MFWLYSLAILFHFVLPLSFGFLEFNYYKPDPIYDDSLDIGIFGCLSFITFWLLGFPSIFVSLFYMWKTEIISPLLARILNVKEEGSS